MRARSGYVVVGLVVMALALMLFLGPFILVAQGETSKTDVFQGPGFLVDLDRWTPFYIEDGVYFCIVENGKFTCATVARGSVLLMPAAPDSTK